jgi:hypothetical protein
MVIYENVFALFPYPPMHPSIYLLLGCSHNKGAKVVVECNEKLYFHYFEEMWNEFDLMNSLFIFWNCVFIFMRLKSHEFGVISLCWKSHFTNKKHFLNNVFQHIWKFGCDFYYSNFYQLFSKLLQVLIYFIKGPYVLNHWKVILNFVWWFYIRFWCLDILNN